MNGFRKSLIVCFMVANFVIAPLETFAWRVSAAGGCSVPHSHPDARGFYDTIKSFPNWTGYYYSEDLNCREIQYKRMFLGGQDDAWIDSSDIHYHVGHGATRWDEYHGKDLTAIIFEDGSSLVPSEARGAWGEEDLEWIAFRNCQLLNDASVDYWAKTMNRLRLILGFKTNSYTHNNFGKIWAQNMRRKTSGQLSTPGQTLTQAWCNTADATQPCGTTVRILVEEHLNSLDHLWSQGHTYQDPFPDPWKLQWDHTVPFPPYLDVNGLTTMKVYEVVPRDVNEAYVRQIGAAFGLAAEPVVHMCDSLVMADLSDPNNPRILDKT
ncbi:MAG: DUF6345 domain-containing protein [Planctomycetota bacterium]|jgi:hypothetical protein